MSYFKKVKVGQKVFGIVFGLGEVKSIFGDGFYTFEVEYESNNQVVPYTEDGIPGWSNKLDYQTVFYKKDMDIMKYDISPGEGNLTAKKIIGLRMVNKLEIKCPSGLWQLINNCPSYIMEEYLEQNKLHLFRRIK